MTTNLSGSLSEFSLAEVLSLLSMGGRTAQMQVTSPSAIGTVHLVDGRISSATADSSRAGLLRGVVAALPVPADDLALALASEDPVRALVESGVVDRDAAQGVAAEHCTEAVGAMLDWTSGEFAVWVGTPDPADIGVRLEVSELVGAARQRSQQWRDLRAELPEADSVLTLVPDVAHAPVVDLEDWAVLARVDGRRTLAEVLAATGASPLAAGNRLVQLLGRGLVAVQVGGGDAEQARANQMLDDYESGGPVDDIVVLAGLPEPDLVHEAPDPYTSVPEVVHEVRDLFGTEPELVQEVHDLFTTEPGAVEEWQVAGADPWVVADPQRWVISEPDEVEGVVQVLPAPVPMLDEQVGPEFQSVDPASDPGVPGLGWMTEEEPASSVVVEAAVTEVEPEPVVLEPSAEPVVEPFAWSPWAQEMGLGAAPVVAAPEPAAFVGRGFADLVEDPGGHGHTEAVPVPQAPEVDVVEGFGTSSGYGEVDEAAQYMPQPRDPADGYAEAGTADWALGAHAADPGLPQAPAASGSEGGAVEPEPDSAPDPLAGGLLAHLMSSVRGL